MHGSAFARHVFAAFVYSLGFACPGLRHDKGSRSWLCPATPYRGFAVLHGCVAKRLWLGASHTMQLLAQSACPALSCNSPATA
jgi:hypothetical protein